MRKNRWGHIYSFFYFFYSCKNDLIKKRKKIVRLNFLHLLTEFALIINTLALHDFCTILHDLTKIAFLLHSCARSKNRAEIVRPFFGLKKLIINTLQFCVFRFARLHDFFAIKNKGMLYKHINSRIFWPVSNKKSGFIWSLSK